MNKVKRLVSRRYQCQVKFCDVSEGAFFNENETPSSLLNSPFRMTDEIWVPILDQKHLAFFAKIVESRTLSKFELRKIYSLLNLFFESAVRKAERLKLLYELEQHLIRQKSPIVDLLSYKKQRNLYSNTTQEERPNSSQLLKDFLATSALIEASKEEDALKLALDLHRFSGRYAFVHFNDIEQGHPDQFAETLKEIGAVTLYIPDISHLTGNQQQLLLKEFEFGRRIDRPHIIAGLLCSREKALASGLVSKELLESLSQNVFRSDALKGNDSTSKMLSTALGPGCPTITSLN
jgi:hypothetical protein